MTYVTYPRLYFLSASTDFWSGEVNTAVVSWGSYFTPKMFGVYLGMGQGSIINGKFETFFQKNVLILSL